MLVSKLNVKESPFCILYTLVRYVQVLKIAQTGHNNFSHWKPLFRTNMSFLSSNSNNSSSSLTFVYFHLQCKSTIPRGREGSFGNDTKENILNDQAFHETFRIWHFWIWHIALQDNGTRFGLFNWAIVYYCLDFYCSWHICEALSKLKAIKWC